MGLTKFAYTADSTSYAWTATHQQLHSADHLPDDLQQGMAAAGNAPWWNDAWTELRGLAPDAWKVRDAATFRKLIGHLWKALELAMNAAALPLSFIFYVCSKVMTSMIEVPDSGMTFTPVLDTGGEAAQAKFKAKVRYRPQGRVASKRYTNPSDAQRAKVLLPRSLFAAAGVPPVQRRRQAGGFAVAP